MLTNGTIVSRQHGMILIEAIFGITLAAFSLVGLTMLFTGGYQTYLRSAHLTQAVYLAETKIDECSVIPAASLSNDTADSEEIDGVQYSYRRKIAPLENNLPLRQIEVTVQWRELDGYHQTQIVTQGGIGQ
jgi:hypothetical protein